METAGSIAVKSSLVGRILFNSMVLVLGLILFIPSFYKISAFCYHRFHSVAISGEIVAKGMGRNIGCRPNIRYTEPNGSPREFKSKIIYHYLVCPEKGEKITILYREGMPEKTIVAGYFHYGFFSGIFMLIGLYLIYVGGRGRLK